MQTKKHISSLKRQIAGAAKIALIVSLFICSTVSISAQTTKKMRMPQANTTISEALGSLGKQSGMRFSWDRTFDVTKAVTVPTSEIPFDEIMKILLKGSNHVYTTSGSFVLIKPQVVQVKPEAIPKVKPKSAEPKTTPTAIDNSPTGVAPKVTEERVETLVLAVLPVKSEVKTPEISNVVINNFTSVPTYELKYSLNPTLKQALPRVAIKTNLLYDALLNVNIGFEIRVSPRMTLDIPVNYNGWRYSENKRLNNIMVQPELRLWVHEPFNGHFFGLHAHYAHFNTGGIKAPFGLWKDWRTTRYQGDLYGVGLSYGYQWILGNRWNLEATAGLGYFHAKYDRYECRDCGSVVTKGTKDYFGPTKLGLSLIFIIK